MKNLGLGGDDDSGKDRLDPQQSRRVMRIRETMRWRGYDLEPYTDDEIVRAADRLGQQVSDDGETSEGSREALWEALRSGLGAASEPRPEPEPAQAEPETIADPEPESPVPASGETEAEAGPGRPPPYAHVAENPFSPEEAEEPPEPEVVEPEPVAAATLDAADEAEAPATPAYAAPPQPPDAERTGLVRLRHVFGIHTWRSRQDERGTFLYCPGCQRDRRGRLVADASRPPIAFPRADAPPQSRSEGPQGAGRAEPGSGESGGATGLLRWYVASPWWVKAVSIFFVLQIVTVVISLLGGGGASE